MNSASDLPIPQGAKLIERPTEGECRCGRPAAKVHCPVCGRMDIYCRTQEYNVVTNADDTKTLLRVYRCKTCGIVFNDQDWMSNCMAPFRKKSRRQIAEDLIQRAQMKSTDASRIINEQFGGDKYAYVRALGQQMQEQLKGPKKHKETEQERAERIEHESVLENRRIEDRRKFLDLKPTQEVPSTVEAEMSKEEAEASAKRAIEQLRALGIKEFQ